MMNYNINDAYKGNIRHEVKRRGLLKRMLPETLFFRSLLILIVPILLIQIVVTTIFFDRHWSKVTSRLAFAVAGEIAIIVQNVDNVGSSDDADKNSNIQSSKLIDLFSRKLDLLVGLDKGQKLPVGVQKQTNLISWDMMIKAPLDKELGKLIDLPYTISVDFKEKWISVRVQTSKGVLNIDVPQRRLFSSTTYIFLLWVFAASMILLIIAVLFMRNQIRPIRRLAIAAERLGKGRNVDSFKVEGAREVRQAGYAFLDMKSRIQRQISQRMDMLAGVSHDLRTPLTRLKLQIAMMGDSPDIYEMKKDINDMEKMIDGYLNFVRGEGREKSSLVNIANMLNDLTISAKRQGVDVTLELNGLKYEIILRPVAFKRCLSNIISNAMKYAEHIWITLQERSDANEVEIIIEDNGKGIDEDKFDEVFRPFYRVEGSRNQETGGIGLGLPIAMDIVHSHGGEIWLERSPRGGLSVYITLPI